MGGGNYLSQRKKSSKFVNHFLAFFPSLDNHNLYDNHPSFPSTTDTMAPKKSKKDANSINSRLALVMKSGKVTMGYKSTLKSLRSVRF